MSAAQAELVLDARATVGEGAVWNEARQELLWVDIPAGAVHRLDTRAGKDVVLDAGQPVGAVARRAGGGLVLAVRDGFALVDAETSEARLVREVEAGDRSARMNDGACDSRGRFWAGTMALALTPGAGSLYRLGPDLQVDKLLDGLTISNGIGWSPDDRTMYLVDSGEYCVDAFDFDAGPGTISNRRRLIEVPPEAGMPDGLAVDSTGALWIAFWGGWSVRRYSAEGELEGAFELPAEFVTSCAFGGEGLDELYVTTAAEGVAANAQQEQPHAGGVFRLRPGRAGPAAHLFAG